MWKAIEDESEGVRLTVMQIAYEVKSPEARAVIEKDKYMNVRKETLRFAELLAKESKEL